MDNMQTLDTSFVETENSHSQNNEYVTDTRLNLDLERFDSINLKSPTSEKAAKCPIYAEVKKNREKEKTPPASAAYLPTVLPQSVENTATNDLNIDSNKNTLDVHTLTVLWLILSGCNVEDCLLEGNEMAGVNFGAFLPTDQKVLRLLLEAGAVEQADVEGCEYESQVSLYFLLC